MNKKFLLVVVSLFIFTCTAFGYSTPRWFNMPVTVYMPSTTGSGAVKNAFMAWQNKSYNTVRFSFRTSSNLKSLSDISVSIVDSADRPYYVDVYRTVFENTNKDKDGNYKNKYFYKMNIEIARANSSGKPYTQSELYAIALRAVGEALGVSASGDNGVMSSQFSTSHTSLNSNDIKLLNNVYKK